VAPPIAQASDHAAANQTRKSMIHKDFFFSNGGICRLSGANRPPMAGLSA
jgi:hypothetical protein